MKIINVTPGLIQIPPNGWGAVEKIIWEIHQNLLKLGHDSQIKYLDEVTSDADIVHIHVANLAIMARERGIPYYFTTHDHHAYLNGKDSWVYKQNLEAMKGAIKSFVPAKFLIEYFEGIPEYFSHGVNTNYFTPGNPPQDHKLLCVANNGYAHDQTIDRKGFGVAIEVARQLGLPITIAGPSNNKNYFSKYPPSYDKLTILYDLSEEQLLTTYKNHSIFLHPSELEAGHPNLTLVEALSCGLPIVGTFESNNKLDGMKIVSANVEETVRGVQEVISKYEQYSFSARNQAKKLDWYNRTQELLSIYSQKEQPNMKKQLIEHYMNTPILRKVPIKKVNTHCINGMFTEILGGPDTSYLVKFIDKKTNTTIYENTLGRNSWAKTNIKYYVDWKIEITDKNSGQVETYELDLKGKRVFISLDSKSLGDTLAWIPYVEEFRKKHQCEVICSTFMNGLFIDEYPNIHFVKPGEVVHNIVAMYEIGLFYKENKELDKDKHPQNPLHFSLQQIASDILGLEHREVKPKIKKSNIKNVDSKQVAIAIHSTAQSKYWNNPTGWQTVVDWLKERGYTVKLMSQEPDGYMGNKNPTGIEIFPRSSIEKVIEELQRSVLFIGISSGLSWLSWAAGTPTMMISGFTDPINEMEDCIRIAAPVGKCSGCWHRHKFDPGDWNWCPDHKGTPRQYECSKDITTEMVIDKLEEFFSETSKTKSYGGKMKTFSMIDVVQGIPNKQLVMSDEQFWNTIYQDNQYGWWGTVSKSGEGSEGRFAEYKKKLIENIMATHSLKSLLDVGCGDFNWMSRVTNIQNYTGIDIVQNMIDEHNKNYGLPNRKFIYGNTANTKFHTDFINENDTNYDIVVLFDILGHQLWDEIENTLNFLLYKLNVKYILATSQPYCNPNYWKEKTSRNESVDISIHPLMIQRGFEVVEKFDHDLVLYRLR